MYLIMKCFFGACKLLHTGMSAEQPFFKTIVAYSAMCYFKVAAEHASCYLELLVFVLLG